MVAETDIGWADFTVNFTEGCQNVGPGCDYCYAEDRNKRFGGGLNWGPGAPRRKVKAGIPKMRKINRDAEAFREKRGHWPRVFCSSLSDVFDNAIKVDWRTEMYAEMEAATNTRIQLLTKRVGNVEAMIPEHWTSGAWPQHIGLMITVVNQGEADRDIPKLLDLKERLGIPWIGLSMEPLLGPVNLDEYLDRIDWVIVGGESGYNARPMHPTWATQIGHQCVEAGVAFFFKQWGHYLHTSYFNWHSGTKPKIVESDGEQYVKLGTHQTGRFISPWGEISEFPKALMV